MTSPLVAGQVALDEPAGRLIVLTTVAGSAIAMLTATVVNVALPTLASDLGASSSQQQWVVNAYLLAIASLILVGGSLGDRFGRVRMYRVGVVWFALASLACAVAPTINILIGARLLQGVGAALLTPGSLAIIEATLRPQDRGRAVGQWSGLSGVAGAVGPLVGGLLVDISWRWVFLVNLPVAAVVLALSRQIPESSDPAAQDSKLDWLGAVLTVVALGGAAYTLTQGPAGGFGGLDIAAGTAAIAAIIALVIFEPRQTNPMVPFRLFASRTFVAANTVTLLVYGGMGVVFFLLTIQLQVSLGWSPLASGAALLPVTIMMLVLSARAGALAARIGPRWPLTIGPLLIAAAMFLLSNVSPGDSYFTAVLPPVLLFGLGLSASVAPVTATALGAVPDDRAGAASGMNNAVARTGQLLAVAAIPPLVGLTGDALGDPDQLTAGFESALRLGAALVAAGGLAAALLFRDQPDCPSRSDEANPLGLQCPIDGPQPSVSAAGSS